jgi:SpoVK/Ycf46/Vps4 family AAA+-type ATPase
MTHGIKEVAVLLMGLLASGIGPWKEGVARLEWPCVKNLHSEGIIMMGATNRPEVLAPALLWPGCFDRQILVDRPDLHGRSKIFELRTRDLLLKKDVDLRKMAAETPGFAGSEITSVYNEAALLASRQGENAISIALLVGYEWRPVRGVF